MLNPSVRCPKTDTRLPIRIKPPNERRPKTLSAKIDAIEAVRTRLQLEMRSHPNIARDWTGNELSKGETTDVIA